jgi:chromosome segregation ATPase
MGQIVSDYLEMPCPQCKRSLRIRTSYVGLRLACKHCQHKFRVEGESKPPISPAPGKPAESAIATKKEVLRPSDSVVRDRELLSSLQFQLEQVRKQEGRSPALEHELDDLRIERDALKIELAEVKATASRVTGLEAELTAARAEADRLRGDAGERERSRETIEELQHKLAADSEVRARLEQRAATLESELCEARRVAGADREERDAEAAKVRELQSQIENLEQRLSTLDLEHEESRLDSTRAFREARDQWHQERANDKTQWQMENQGSLQSLERELQDMRNKFEEERAALSFQVEAALCQAKRLTLEQESLAEQMQVKERERAQIAMELESVRSDRDLHMSTREELSSHLAKAQTEMEALRQNEENLRVRSAELIDELSVARENFAALERQLVESRVHAPVQSSPPMNGNGTPAAETAPEPDTHELREELSRQRDEIEALKNTLQLMGIIL